MPLSDPGFERVRSQLNRTSTPSLHEAPGSRATRHRTRQPFGSTLAGYIASGSLRRDGFMARRYRFLLLATALIPLAAAPAVLAAGDTRTAAPPAELDDYDVASLGVGGPIALTDQDGRPFTLAQLQGHVALMF